MNTYFTSDTHFFHKSILKFCPDSRGYATSVEEMNELLIESWNKQVNPTDTVYHLGDFSLGTANKTEAILARLNGYKHLILGNHDGWLNPKTRAMFEHISQYREIRMNGIDVIMFHFPIAEWHKAHYGSVHLFGHTHGNYKPNGRSLDVGIDARPQKDMKLWAWEEIVESIKDKEIITHHGKVR